MVTIGLLGGVFHRTNEFSAVMLFELEQTQGRRGVASKFNKTKLNPEVKRGWLESNSLGPRKKRIEFEILLEIRVEESMCEAADTYPL